MRGLFIVPTDYDSLAAKGVLHLLRDREEGGALSQVVTVHPFTQSDRRIDIGLHHVIYEMRPPWGDRWRPLARLGFLLHVFRTAKRARSLVRRYRCDFVRAQDPYLCGLIGWLSTRWPWRRPFCISIHADYDKRYELDGSRGAPELFGSRKLSKALERFVMQRADRVLPIRASIAETVRKMGVAPGRVTIMPHGVDMALYEPADKRPSVQLPQPLMNAQARNWLVFAGRLSRENYVYDLLEIAARLAKRRADFLVVLMGGGPEEGALKHRLEKEPILSRFVILTGFVTNDVVAAVRRRAAVGLAPMGGFSLIEACAAGRPVVAYDVEWHHELVRNGETGFLVPEGDVGALSERVAYLLDHPKEAARLGRQARNLAFKMHARENVRSRRISVYQELMGERA